MTKGSKLRCVACGGDAGYNRAVVDTLADKLVGGMCLRCERTGIEGTLDRSITCDQNCSFCAHDGFFALPKWTLERGTRASHQTGLTVGYAVEDGTARLCDGHFHELARARTPETADAADAADGREPFERL